MSLLKNNSHPGQPLGPKHSRPDVLVIGAGAAGLMCAAVAAQRGLQVLVVDHANRVGKKILMSGGGRCNFTNLDVQAHHFLSANPHFCKSALARYTPADFIALVQAHHIAFHEKEAGQLFCDNSSKDIVRLLLEECQAGHVEIRTHCSVSDLQPLSSEGFAVQTSLGPLQCAKIVIATGGLSIPKMGATGWGYKVASQFGHRVQPTRAGLVPLTLSGDQASPWAALSGLSLPIRASTAKQQFQGNMLLTHRGLSGPAILQISSYWQPGQDLRIELLPEVDIEQWLSEQSHKQPKQQLSTSLSQLFPKRFAHTLCHTMLADRPLQQVQGKWLRQTVDTLSNWPIRPSGTEGYRTAEVTLGGVDTREVCSKTFVSRKVPGLHFIGEVLDVTGHLGGYNFQWAWASAQACALAL
nr:NAD(P)/FAD-dependent oxidoreductase [Oceanococcus sp. HetDA_MAG_MS8]